MATNLSRHLASEPVSQVEIFVSCKNLIDMDILSKSDPLCLLKIYVNNQWVEHGRTERIMNNLNPNFSKSFTLDYFFEEVQKIKFLIYDIDNLTPQLDDDDFLGQYECTIGEVVSGSPLMRQLMRRDNKTPIGKSFIVLRAEELGKQKDLLTLQFSGTKLDQKDFFGKSDPYLEFNRRMNDGGYQVVHRTETIMNTLNPTWKTFEIRSDRLSGNNYQESIKVDCFDYNSSGNPDFIGSFETSIQEMMSAADKKIQWDCINPKKKAKKSSYKNSGIITLNSCRVSKAYSFLDYVFGGLQLKFSVAVDFTASNGDPRNHDSLHYLTAQYPNHYTKAIRSVGEVVKDYNSDQLFPCLGFGAKIPPNMEVSHCFALNFNTAYPFCYGIQGILDAYFNSLTHVQLYGPTNFSPVINHIAQFASAAQQRKDNNVYFVLLIITDGVISDMANAIRAIVQASHIPMSIIIVGVGEADFDAMDQLDADDRLLRDQWGGAARRDIVQFVPFRQYENVSQAALAKVVLAELPGQVVEYFKIMNVPPGKPRQESEMNVGLNVSNPSDPSGISPRYPQSTNMTTNPSNIGQPPNNIPPNLPPMGQQGTGNLYPNVVGAGPSSNYPPYVSSPDHQGQIPQPGKNVPMGQQQPAINQAFAGISENYKPYLSPYNSSLSQQQPPYNSSMLAQQPSFNDQLQYNIGGTPQQQYNAGGGPPQTSYMGPPQQFSYTGPPQNQPQAPYNPLSGPQPPVPVPRK